MKTISECFVHTYNSAIPAGFTLQGLYRRSGGFPVCIPLRPRTLRVDDPVANNPRYPYLGLLATGTPPLHVHPRPRPGNSDMQIKTNCKN